LNLTDADTGFSDDGTNEDVRNEEAHRVRLGGGCRRSLEILLVEGAHNEAECFGHSINLAAYSKDTFNSASRVVANGALGARQTTDLSYVLSALANDSSRLAGANTSTHM
jgi:hypothetical protein